MYHYVENKEFLKRAQSSCSDLMSELEEELREHNINSQFFLVGSGARNMVTQNEDESIDFDYNLNILSCEDFDDCKYIKETVRKAFNQVLRNNGLSDSKDSTTLLTTCKIYFINDPSIEFSIDVCIVTRDCEGRWYRLKHQKGMNTYYDRYYWNEYPSSYKYKEKSKAIKEVPGYWSRVRERYLDIKNMYLVRNDHYHPSFVCYIQAVNDVYNEMKRKKIIK